MNRRDGGLRRGRPEQPKVDINTLEDIVCECGEKIFTQLARFKKIPALMSNTGKEQLYPIIITICAECGKQLLLQDAVKDSSGGGLQ